MFDWIRDSFWRFAEWLFLNGMHPTDEELSERHEYLPKAMVQPVQLRKEHVEGTDSMMEAAPQPLR